MRGPQHNWPEQLFVISDEIIEASPIAEVEATWQAMSKLGIARPPFDRFAVMVTGKHFLRVASQDTRWTPDAREHAEREFLVTNMRIHFSNTRIAPDGANEADAEVWLQPPGSQFIHVPELESPVNVPTYQQIYRFLIVVLATKNVVKTRSEDKLAKLGIGKKKRFRYTTTISVGAIEDDPDRPPSAGTGRHRVPHLRRGHPRNQHWGPGNQYIKRIFVPPVFVNGDKEWLKESHERDHSNLIQVKTDLLP